MIPAIGAASEPVITVEISFNDETAMDFVCTPDRLVETSWGRAQKIKMGRPSLDGVPVLGVERKMSFESDAQSASGKS